MKWRLASVLFFGFVTICRPAFGDFKEGVDAIARGDYAAALREFQPLAEKGHAGAQTKLGQMHLQGHGVPQNYAESTMWFRKAAIQGNADAQNSLGRMYQHGMGVPKDYAKALTWYRKATEEGHAGAQNQLGVMYARGKGVPKDYVQAHMWFNLAASRGLMRAARNKDIVAKRMTAAQIAEAERLAREWKPKKQ